MVNVTPNANISFPEPTDPVSSLADTVGELAQQQYGLRDLIAHDAVTGWNVTRLEAQPILGDSCYLLIADITYTAATAITATDTTGANPGNLTNITMTTLASYRPPANFHGIPMVNVSGVNVGVSTWTCVLLSTGALQLSHGPTGGKIIQNANFQIRHLIHRIA